MTADQLSHGAPGGAAAAPVPAAKFEAIDTSTGHVGFRCVVRAG